MSRFTRFSRGKIWFDDIGPCKRFDILQLCGRMYCWVWKLQTNSIANLLKLLEMSKRKFLLRTGVALVGFGTLLTTVQCRCGNYFHHHRCYHHMDRHCYHYNSAWALALISLSMSWFWIHNILEAREIVFFSEGGEEKGRLDLDSKRNSYSGEATKLT